MGVAGVMERHEVFMGLTWFPAHVCDRKVDSGEIHVADNTLDVVVVVMLGVADVIVCGGGGD